MNNTDTVFYLEMMKNCYLGAMQKNIETLNKFDATASNAILEKNVEALENAIEAVKCRMEG